MQHIFVLVLLAIPIWLNIKASRFIVGDEFSERSQKIIQLLWVWFLPIVGAVLILAVHRPTEAPSRQYRQEVDPGDDFARSGHSTKIIREALDDES